MSHSPSHRRGEKENKPSLRDLVQWTAKEEKEKRRRKRKRAERPGDVDVRSSILRSASEGRGKEKEE